MPRGNRTGPAGLGPMTGRAAGYCAGYTVPGFGNPVSSRGYGAGFTQGRGLGFLCGRAGREGRKAAPYAGCGYVSPPVVPYAAVPTREQEIDALSGQAKYFEDALADIKKRLAELEAEKTQK